MNKQKNTQDLESGVLRFQATNLLYDFKQVLSFLCALLSFMEIRPF